MAFLLIDQRLLSNEATAPGWRRVLKHWFINVRTRRAQHTALATLLAYDDARLDDLGLCRQDLLEAIHSRAGGAGATLAAARARRAGSWGHSA